MELISRQAATTIPVMPKEHRHYQTNNLDDAYEQGWNDLQECIENLPPVQPDVPDTNVGDMISRQAAIDALWKALYEYEDKTEKQFQESEDLDIQDWIQHRIFVQNMSDIDRRTILDLPPVQPKNWTLIIPLNESDFKSVRRIMLDNKPWCRTFYEDVPGEAHWIKSYTPDDGEIYECDNCGVTWQFTDGGPEENEAFFCPKCGFKMMPKEEEEADGQE